MHPHNSIWEERFGDVGHECSICLDGDDMTPILFAYYAMKVPPAERSVLIHIRAFEPGGNTAFSLGWTVGLGRVVPDQLHPFGAGQVNPQAVRAWLLGYTAGRYALENGFQSPGCRLHDPREHMSGEVMDIDHYTRMVEDAGRFPVSSISGSPVARAIIQPLMDAEQPYGAAAVIIGQAVSLGVFAVKSDPQFDGNPTLDSRSIEELVIEDYIKRLDADIRGWYWTSTVRMSIPIRNAAIIRRCQITGAHGFQVSGMNFVHNDAPHFPNEPMGRYAAGVASLDAKRSSHNMQPWYPKLPGA